MSGVAAKKKPARKRAERLPVLEVDVDDEGAIGAIAEALVTAIMEAATGGGRSKRKKPAKKAKKAGKPRKAPKARKAEKGRKARPSRS